ncbi:hypothetical protein CU669_10175 [Paramagnetospirillum kuznetsovii]|uniref:Uncharacterized protein n=2 Tax=Paramagnetospirillum kuznetsovii TaxID=2053833 RepID=A0A364NYQ7_9PROT|nr:hypothetical protein CU669_10175 [Paramagnetospirillum kuznetsovii]
MFLGFAAPAKAADEAPPPALAQPLPAAAVASPVEETPGFQAVRTMEAPPPVAAPVVISEPPPAPAVPVVAAPPPPPPPPPLAAPTPAMSMDAFSMPAGWLSALMLVLGAAIAGWTGTVVAKSLYQRDEDRRLAAVRSILGVELEARRQAFEAVPVPPNAEAGVSFVSAVAALADMDTGWRAAQASLHLLNDKQASHLSVHYSAVRYVANFVKGQSFAAALRMLQANRIGGNPCPDPAAMREAHVELAAAFRGVDKIIQGLKG